MEIKNTVKNKLVKAKDKAAEIAVVVTPYIAIGATFGFVTFVTGMTAYKKGYSRGVLNGAQAGKNAVIEIISDLVKSVGTK